MYKRQLKTRRLSASRLVVLAGEGDEQPIAPARATDRDGHSSLSVLCSYGRISIAEPWPIETKLISSENVYIRLS